MDAELRALRRRLDGSPDDDALRADFVAALERAGEEGLLLAAYRAGARCGPTVLEELSASDEVVMIVGSPEGRFALARALHDEGHRREGPFETVDVPPDEPSSLTAVRLFGTERSLGFSGAPPTLPREGLIERCAGGSILIHVEHLAIDGWQRLSRALAERRVARIGGVRQHRLDTRLFLGSRGEIAGTSPLSSARRLHLRCAIPSFGDRQLELEYRPRPGAYAVALDEQGRLALVRTPDGLHLPGGGIDEQETEEAALAREVREETGHVLVAAEVAVHADEWVIAAEGPLVKRCAFFRATFGSKVVDPTERDHELVWVPLASALREMANDCQRWAVGQLTSGPASATSGRG